MDADRPLRHEEHQGAQRLSLCIFAFFCLLTCPAIAQTIYTTVLGNQNYVVGSSTLRSGLFVSYDSARTWKHVGPENLKTYSMDGVDSSNGRILYIAAGNGIHKTTDYGESWKIVTDWRMTEVLDVQVDQRNPDYVYAATAFGFWMSSDAGVTWKNPEGPLKESYCYRISDGTSMISIIAEGTQRQISTLVSITDSTVQTAIQLMRSSADWADAFNLVYVPTGVNESLLCFSDMSGIHTESEPIGLSISTPFKTTFSLPFTPPPLPVSSVVHALDIYARSETPMLLAGTFGDGLYSWDGKEWKLTGLPGSQIWRIIVKDYNVPVEVGHEH